MDDLHSAGITRLRSAPRVNLAIQQALPGIPVAVRALYDSLRFCDKLGGEGCGGSLYGEISRGDVHRILIALHLFTGLSPSSAFIDIGSGFGKPSLHAALAFGCRISAGIELMRPRVDISVYNISFVAPVFAEDARARATGTPFDVSRVRAAVASSVDDVMRANPQSASLMKEAATQDSDDDDDDDDALDDDNDDDDLIVIDDSDNDDGADSRSRVRTRSGRSTTPAASPARHQASASPVRTCGKSNGRSSNSNTTTTNNNSSKGSKNGKGKGKPAVKAKGSTDSSSASAVPAGSGRRPNRHEYPGTFPLSQVAALTDADAPALWRAVVTKLGLPHVPTVLMPPPHGQGEERAAVAEALAGREWAWTGGVATVLAAAAMRDEARERDDPAALRPRGLGGVPLPLPEHAVRAAEAVRAAVASPHGTGALAGVRFAAGDATKMATLEPFTHVYQFDIALGHQTQVHLARLFNQSQSCIALVSFQPPKMVIGEFGYVVEPVAMLSCTMQGSSEGKTAYIYRKVRCIEAKMPETEPAYAKLPPDPAADAAAAAAASAAAAAPLPTGSTSNISAESSSASVAAAASRPPPPPKFVIDLERDREYKPHGRFAPPPPLSAALAEAAAIAAAAKKAPSSPGRGKAVTAVSEA